MAEEEVLSAVAAYGCLLVEVTGGEPLAQPGCRPLLARLAEAGYEVLLETSGALPIEGVDPRVRIIMDLKCPGSGESGRNLWSNLGLLKPEDEIKLVVASREDYEWARGVVRDRRLAERHPVLLSPVWEELEPGRLAAWILEDRLPARMQLQLHKLLFGAGTRGV
jgi:7-carboxy-7-deazaguanine synthase